MSPLELAHDMEVFPLYEILRPVINSPLPLDTLHNLEHQFHSLIRSEVGKYTDVAKLYLPVLEALTELKGDSVWFPLKIESRSAVSMLRPAVKDSNRSTNYQVGIYFPALWKRDTS
jgi:hypothetical protein